MSKPTIQQISIDTRAIIDRLAEAQVGEVITYQELTDLIGRDVQTVARGNLRTAVLHFERDGIIFGTVIGEGIKLLPDNELVGAGENGVGRIRRLARRTARKLAGFRDFAALGPSDKTRVLAHQSVLGAISSFTRPRTVDRIAAGLTEEQKALPVGRTIELFKKL